MTQSANSPTQTLEPDVRPQRPKAARPKPAWPDLPNAWQKNPAGLAGLFLLLNFGLYFYAALLFSRLTTGLYLNVVLFGPPQGTPLGQFLLEPVNIYQAPMYAIVVAFLLAVLLIGPVITAQFYGRGWACLFLIPLLTVAHLPLLTAAMSIAIWLANTHRLGIINRFGRAIVAFMPAIVAAWVSTWRTDLISRSPAEKFYLHVPWIAAILLAALIMLLFWVAARLLRYRAGLGTIGISLLILATAAVFNRGVGQDELEFRLLNARYGLSSPHHFQNGPLADTIDRIAVERMAQDGLAQPRPDQIAEYRSQARVWLKMRATTDLESARDEIARACQQFLTRFPDSRYVPYVRFLLARCMDMRVDLLAISLDEKLTHYEDCPSPQGLTQWQWLYVYQPDHPLAVIARVRLAQARIAAGRLDEGHSLMADAHRQLARLDALAVPHVEPLARQSRDPVARHIVEERTRQVPYWLWIIEKNRGPGPQGDDPLARLFALDPRQPDYQSQLETLARSYPASRLADNLDLLVRLQKDDEEKRVQSLWAFIKSKSGTDSDARLLAMAELANLLVKQDSAAQRDEARMLWQELLVCGEPLFADEARQGLISIGEMDPTTAAEP